MNISQLNQERHIITSMDSKHSYKLGTIKSTLIAPCGMNCRLCRAYQREKNSCPGCYRDDRFNVITRVNCKIKNCATIKSGQVKFCFACEQYPCGNLKHLDKRYRTKYGMSMLENLENIERSGIRAFIRQEKKKWACPECGEILCVHQESCSSCGHRWR
jgi:hypothetical protein